MKTRWLYSRTLPLVAILIMLLAAALLLVDIGGGPTRPRTLNIWILILGLLALGLLLTASIMRLIRLIRQLRQGVPGARLARRLTTIFLALTLPPAIIVYLFSLVFLNETIDDWLNVGQEQALANAIELARVILDQRTLEAQREIRELTLNLQERINSNDSSDWFPLLIDQVSSSGPVELSILDERGNVLSSASINSGSLAPDRPRDFTLVQILDNQLYAEAEPVGSAAIGDAEQPLGRNLKIRAAMVIPDTPPGQPERILQAIYHLPEQFGQLAGEIETAYFRNQTVTYLRDALKLSFIIILTLVLALSLLIGILAAFGVAQRLVRPLTRLAQATGKVAAGRYHQDINLETRDELGFLVRSFNRMSLELDRSRRHLEQQRQYLETVLNRLSAGVLSFDREGRLITGNASAAEILGFDLRRCIEMPLTEISKHHPDLEPLLARIEARRHQALDWREEIHLRRSGKPLVLVCRGSRLPDSQQGLVVVFDDVTVLTEAQRQAAWSEVARRLAHEVKNPLTPIRLAAERVGRKLTPRLDTEHREMLDRATRTIVKQVEALQSMVNAFADYALDRKTRTQPLDMHALLDEITNLYETATENIHFEHRLEAHPATILADPGRLRQVLHNLIRNAQDAASDQGGLRIELHTRNERRAGSAGVLLQLTDNGPGIDPAILNQVFEPYTSTKSGAEGRHTAGLGLAIVQRIIDEAGGSIHLENVPGNGARASIWLPAARGDPADWPGPAVQSAQYTGI